MIVGHLSNSVANISNLQAVFGLLFGTNDRSFSPSFSWSHTPLFATRYSVSDDRCLSLPPSFCYSAHWNSACYRASSVYLPSRFLRAGFLLPFAEQPIALSGSHAPVRSFLPPHPFPPFVPVFRTGGG